MSPPANVDRMCGQVCVVKGSLYGLAPAAQIWYNYVSSILSRLGFRRSPYDTALWKHTTRPNLYLITHVDDINIFAEVSSDAKWVITPMIENVEIKDLQAAEKYLGMQIVSKDISVDIHQTPYIEVILEDFALQSVSTSSVPIAPSVNIDDSPFEDIAIIRRYQQGVGCLNHLVNWTRPDVLCAASFLGQ